MADAKISELPEATTPLAGTELVPIVQGGETRRAPASALTPSVVNSVGASRLLGRGSAGGTGVAQEITLGANLSMSGTVLSATGGGATAWGPLMAARYVMR